MVVEAVEGLASVVIHKFMHLVNEESQTFEKVTVEVQRVMAEIEDMQIILKNAEHQEPSNKVLTDWVMLFLSKVYRVGDVIESFSLAEKRLKGMGFVKKHSFIIANELKLCRELPEEMDYYDNVGILKFKLNTISKEIPKWKEGKPKLAPARQQGFQAALGDINPWEWGNAYYTTKREKTIFKKDVEKLLNQLTSNSNSLAIISVFGEVGIGKTAHVKKIYNKLQVKNMFSCRALVVVHANYSVRDILIAILQQVTSLKRLSKLNVEVLRGKLHSFLKEHKYIIVINDIKSFNLLDGLTGAFPDAYNGSRVVITTPNKEAASFADPSSCYHFKPLDMEEGFKFFISKTWGKKQSPFKKDDMEDLKNKIAESCEGSLLRIAMLAGLLSTRNNYEDWQNVFRQRDFEINSSSFDILGFCYNDLPIPLRPCFLYLSLFRKGFEIPVRRLFRLWLAEGFPEPSVDMIPEDVVEKYLEELVKRNMVEITKRRSDESPKKCRMIGVLHDMFLQRAVKIGLFHLHQKSVNYSNAAAEHRIRIRRVVEYTNIKVYSNSKAFNQNLQSYISFNGRNKDMPAVEVGRFLEKIIGSRGFGLLKVLDLEGVYRPQLPETLGNLFHLRYLGLRWTFLDTLPSSLGSLLYLETLDIKHTHITTLPSSIWNMKRLRHLCLNGAHLDIHEHSTKHRAPSQLQTLWGLFVDEKIARKIGLTLSKMTNLRKLDLTRQSSPIVKSTSITTPTTTTTTTTTHSSSYEEIGLWITKMSSLQSLRLRAKNKMGRPSELIIKPLSTLRNLSQLYLLGHLNKSLAWYQIPPGLKVLTLSVSKLDEDPMPTLSRLPSLMVLRLLADSYVGKEMHCPENTFPALRILKLWTLENLNILTVHEGTMQNLHTLEIRCCTGLQGLPATLLQIQSFENLILTNMPKSFVSAIRAKKQKHTKIVENKWDF